MSFVRSIDMDSWSEKQLNMMQNGGNAKLRSYLAEYPFPQDSIDNKYASKAAVYYRLRLKSIVEG